MAPRTASRRDYFGVLSPKACMPDEAVLLATAIQRARTPAYSMPLDNGMGQPITDLIADEINLWVIAGSDGILEFQLIREGGGSEFTQLPVVKGQKIEGHFAQIGSNTTCLPLVGFGNLP